MNGPITRLSHIGLVFIMTAILPNFAGLPLLLDLTPGKMRRLD